MSKETKKPQKTKASPSSQKQLFLGTVRRQGVFFNTLAVVAIYIALCLTPFVGPYAQFPFQVVRCLGLPVIATEFAGGRSYAKPGSQFYQVDFFSGYFCSAQEAESHEYSDVDR